MRAAREPRRVEGTQPAWFRGSGYTASRQQTQVALVSRHILDIFMIAALVFSASGMIAACGQKGPLYLPEDSEKEKEKEKESRDRSYIKMPRRPA